MKTFIWTILATVISFGSVTVADAEADIDQDMIYVSTAKNIDMKLNGYAYLKIQKIGEERKKVVVEQNVHPIISAFAGKNLLIAVPVYVDFIRSGKPGPQSPSSKEVLRTIEITMYDDALKKFYVKLWESKRPGVEFKNVHVFSYFMYHPDQKSWRYLDTTFSLIGR